MATITASSIAPTTGAVTTTTLDGSSDTFTYNSARKPVLILHNPTGGAISATIVGADYSSPISVPSYGDVSSASYAVGSIAAGDTQAIVLNSIRGYLAGAITISSGSGLEAQLLEF